MRAHQPEKVLGDIEPESGAFNIAVALLLDPLKLHEELLDVLGTDADSGILYLNLEQNASRVIGILLISHAERHAAGFGIFNRVRQYIRDHLPDADLISAQVPRYLPVKIELQLQPFIIRALPYHGHQLTEHPGEIVINGDDLEPAFFDPREIKYIVYQAEQSLPRVPDAVRVIAYRRVVRFAQDHLVHSEHRVNGRTDLMRHI